MVYPNRASWGSPLWLARVNGKSMITGVVNANGEAIVRKPIYGQVFTLEEIVEIVQKYGMPGDKWKTEEYWRYDRFIEAQVWDDRPIWEFVESTNHLCR